MCFKREPPIHDSKTTLEGFLKHRPPIHDFKINLEGLDLHFWMTSMQELQIYQFRLYVD